MKTDERGEPLDKDFIVSSLDLLDGLVCGLKGSFEGLAHASNLPNLLAHCLAVAAAKAAAAPQHSLTRLLVRTARQDEEDRVRHAAVIMVGDLASMCPAYLAPVAADMAPLVVRNLASFEAKKVKKACGSASPTYLPTYLPSPFPSLPTPGLNLLVERAPVPLGPSPDSVVAIAGLQQRRVVPERVRHCIRRPGALLGWPGRSFSSCCSYFCCC